LILDLDITLLLDPRGRSLNPIDGQAQEDPVGLKGDLDLQPGVSDVVGWTFVPNSLLRLPVNEEACPIYDYEWNRFFIFVNCTYKAQLCTSYSSPNADAAGQSWNGDRIGGALSTHCGHGKRGREKKKKGKGEGENKETDIPELQR